jgi:hypothetical protein
MTKTILTAVLEAAFVLPARAEEKTAAKSSGFMGFFTNLKNSLAASAVAGERKKTRGAAVAAVRGKKQKDMADPNEPTLKGDSKTRKAMKEADLDAKLASYAQLAIDGKREESLKAFEAFKAENPKHQAEMVDKAISELKAPAAE